MSRGRPLLCGSLVAGLLLGGIGLLLPRGSGAAPRLLSGSLRKAAGGAARLRVPAGFAAWSEGKTLRVARRKIAPGLGVISLTAAPADPRLEAVGAIGVAERLAGEVLAESEMRHSGLTRLRWEEKEAPETLRLPGGEAGRLLRGAIGRDGAPLTLFVGALRAGGWVFVLGGVWRAEEDPKLLPAADTLLRTLKVRPPRENTALRKRLLGCWDLVVDAERSKTTRGRYRFEPSGRYSYSGEFAISVAGAEGFGARDEHGSFRVYGRQIHTRDDHGEPGAISVGPKGKGLLLRGERYRPCEGPGPEAHPHP